MSVAPTRTPELERVIVAAKRVQAANREYIAALRDWQRTLPPADAELVAFSADLIGGPDAD